MVLFTDYLTGIGFEETRTGNKRARRRFLAVYYGHNTKQSQDSGYMSRPVDGLAGDNFGADERRYGLTETSYNTLTRCTGCSANMQQAGQIWMVPWQVGRTKAQQADTASKGVICARCTPNAVVGPVAAAPLVTGVALGPTVAPAVHPAVAPVHPAGPLVHPAGPPVPTAAPPPPPVQAAAAAPPVSPGSEAAGEDHGDISATFSPPTSPQPDAAVQPAPAEPADAAEELKRQLEERDKENIMLKKELKKWQDEKLQRQLEEDTAGQEKAAEDEPAVAEGDFKCAICCDDFWTFPVTTECGHTFCKPCVRMLPVKIKIKPPAKRPCPACREPLGDFCTKNEVDKDKEAAVIQQIGKQDYDASCHRKLAETREFMKTTRKQLPFAVLRLPRCGVLL
jgi:hypothetical protein